LVCKCGLVEASSTRQDEEHENAREYESEEE